jgi:endonuclease YncB( thermonuclease family)
MVVMGSFRAPLAWTAALLAVAFGALLPGAVAQAREAFSGPVVAEVVSVVDGDTLAVRARPWPGLEIAVKVRLVGVDAPEIKGRCDRERRLARQARNWLTLRLGDLEEGAQVRLYDIRNGKYAGRVLARAETLEGEDLGAGLLDAGLARIYEGGRRGGWCAPAVAARPGERAPGSGVPY